MRRLAELPTRWEGKPWDFDKNFAAFDRWFNDNMAYRSLMVRLKNQLDYWLFSSSDRAYFGPHGEIYGRKLLDSQLPTSEHLFENEAPAVVGGLRLLRAQLESQGTHLILIAPMQRQHFTQAGLPFFAPHMTEPSQFMSRLYPQLQRELGSDFIDAHALMNAIPKGQPRFFKQDFHWSDFAAREASIQIAGRIATLDGVPFQWRYPLETYTENEVGSDARFAALLVAEPVAEVRVDNRKWPAVHNINYQDVSATGLEYVTDEVTASGMLPSTCLYGNSFSDAMVSVGLLNHFSSMARVGRDIPIWDLPKVTKGRCKYLVVQLLDISPEWAALASDKHGR